MAVTAMAVYTDPEQPFLSVVLIVDRLHAGQSAERFVLGGFRHGAARFPADPVRLKWFNIAMGVLLAATLWPMLK